MSKPILKTSTAMLIALSFSGSSAVFAQSTLDTLQEGLANADERPICADGSVPACAEGATLLSVGEASATDLGRGNARALLESALEGEARAMCSDGAEAICADGVAVLMPGQDGYEAAVAAEADAAAAETDVAADTEAPAESETAEMATAEAPVSETEDPAMAEATTEGTVAADTDVAAEAESNQGVSTIEADTTAETVVAPGAEQAETVEAETNTETNVASELQRVLQPDPDSDAGRVLQLLSDATDPSGGTSEAPAAVTGGEAEVASTTETEVTEEDTRQSSEDFATDVAGEAEVTAEARNDRDDGRSDLEKAALLGLGALAVGAILSNGDEVVSNSGDRVVLRRGEDDFYVLKDDNALLRQPGSNVRTETFNDGSTRATVTREDGSQIITVRDASGRVVYRTRENPDGTSVVLIDDTETYAAVEVETLPEAETREVQIVDGDVEAIRTALAAASARDVNRTFSLRQIREIEQVRKLVPEIALDTVNFQTASAAIDPSEARDLTDLGRLMAALIDDNPSEIFLIEGHTDAVGNAAYNLALSDRRAESVALALTEYFDVRPENMVIQGYGESDLKVQTLEDERLNRRVTVRRVTPLLSDRVARN